MELVYTDAAHFDQGVLFCSSFDLGYGSDENTFTVGMVLGDDVLEYGSLVYIEGTEYGGVVDKREVDTVARKVIYEGRTWHGILESRVISPPSGQAYYTASGDAHEVLRGLINYLELQTVFDVESKPSGINVSAQFRHDEAYTAIRKMLLKQNSKLIMKKGHLVTLSVKPITRYKDVDSDLIDFKISENSRPVNHLTCRGQGELTNRVIVHLYADAEGNISQTKTFYGFDEVEEKYDYNNAARDELIEKGTERLEEKQNDVSVEVFIDDLTLDIDDLVVATENHTGTNVQAHIIKKIVRQTDDGHFDIEYEAGNTVGPMDENAETQPVEPSSLTVVSETAPTNLKIGDSWLNPETGEVVYEVGEEHGLYRT